MNKAIFLDKDGTLIPDIPYNVKPDLITLNPNVGSGLAILQSLGYLLILISNQSGVALGYFKKESLKDVSNKIEALLFPWNVKMSGYYYCPHFSDGNIDAYNNDCDCRKPKPGLINMAINDFNIDDQKSWMIGDILNDVEAGNRAGCKSILIDNGNETEWVINEYRKPKFISKDFLSAVKFIETFTKQELALNGKEMARL